MSTHSASIIEIKEVRKHENADKLEIIPIANGWQAVVGVGQFKPGDKAVYIEPDYTVPLSRPEFAFLKKDERDRHRLKALRLRGALSYGLLIPVPAELASANVGDNVMEQLGVERYVPPLTLAGADELPFEEHPQVYSSTFDVEILQKFPEIFQQGEEVLVTEKIHGGNARYVYDNGRFYMGSRTRWLKPESKHGWRVAVDSDPRIEDWCRAHPGVVLYGEIYGKIASLKYGIPKSVAFAAFAASYKGEWLNTLTLLEDPDLPTVPLIYRGPYDLDVILPLAEQDSTVPTARKVPHMREGIVIVPVNERRDMNLGRVALKHISNRYWESGH